MAAEKQKCMIIGASPILDSRVFQEFDPKDYFVICADGGYETALKLGLVPDLVVGDFDSAQKRPPASLRTLEEETPVLTAGEETLETTLAVGRSETYLSSWTDCEELLARGTVGETDLSALAVTVYRFTDPYGPEESDEAPNPSLQVRFSLDYDATVVLRFGFEGGSYDREAGEMCQSFSIPRPGEKSYRQERVLIVLGEDVEDLSVTGVTASGERVEIFRNGGWAF